MRRRRPAATVTLAEPADGATFHGAVQLAMTADCITIEETGEARDGAGHFHVIADAGCLDAGTGIDKDADHVHFGAGQSEGAIYLEPGADDLCLQVRDGVHSALDATDTVSISVGVTSQHEWCSVMGEVDEIVDGRRRDRGLRGSMTSTVRQPSCEPHRGTGRR